MSLIINVSDGIISGNFGSEVFARSFDQKIYDEMTAIADKANSTDSVEEYKQLIEDFKTLTVEEIGGYLGTFHDDIFIDNKTGKHYLKYNGVISAVAMPDTMVERIKTSMDQKIDISPLLKSWVRFLRNPKSRKDSGYFNEEFSTRFFNFINIKFTNYEMVGKLMDEKGYSDEVAKRMSTTYSMKITNEGLLAGFKVSEEITTRFRLNEKGEKESYNVYNTGKKSIDPISGLITTEKVELTNEDRVFRPAVQKNDGDEFYCGDKLGHIIRVGQTHRLPNWNYVNCDDNQSCVRGLHVGGLDYIRGYQNDNTCTHNTLICPSKIGAIPNDSTGAMRVLEYFTLDEFSGVNGSIYHSSKYGAKLDKEWSDEKAAIIKAHGEYKEKQDKEDKDIKDSLEAI